MELKPKAICKDCGESYPDGWPHVYNMTTDKEESGDSKSKYELAADLINCIPTNWLDPLLTGDSKVLINKPGQWDCTDIERLLLALRKRLEEKAGI